MFHNISYSMKVRKRNNNKEKMTRQQLRASAIGICTTPPFNIGYNSHTIGYN